MAELIDENNGFIYHLDVGGDDQVTIGKSDECDVVIPPKESRDEWLHEQPPYSIYDFVSRQHGKYDKSSRRLHDLDSSNGTFVNGQRITGDGVDLSEGDKVRLGRLELTFFATV